MKYATLKVIEELLRKEMELHKSLKEHAYEEFNKSISDYAPGNTKAVEARAAYERYKELFYKFSEAYDDFCEQDFR